MRKVTLIAAMVCFATVAPTSHATERYLTSTLQSVYPLSNGDFVLQFDVESPQCSATNSPKYMYVAVGQNGVNAEGSSKMYAAALMALTTRQALSLAFDDATTFCYISRFSVQK